MSRLSRLGKWISEHAGRALSLVFAGVAGAVAVQMATATEADMARNLTTCGIALAGLAVIVFGPGWTLGRGSIMAGLVLAPIWCIAVGYNGVSALEFFDRFLADADARRERSSAAFHTAKAELLQLRARRDAIKTQRPAAVIEAELAKASQRDRDRLAAELEDAKERGKLDSEIKAVAARFEGLAAVGDSATERTLQPVYAGLSAFLGVTISNGKDLRSLLLLLLLEGGNALVPVADTLARRRTRRQAARELAAVRSGSAPVQTPAALGPETAAEREDVKIVRQWATHRTVKDAAMRTPACDLYADYAEYMGARGMRPVSKTRFGSVLSAPDGLALAKGKAGAKWTINYMGIGLKPSGRTARPSGRVLSVVGGEA